MHNTHFKDAVKSKCKKIALFTFWTGTFVKYDILTEYLTWFAMLVNEYKLDVSIQKSSKDCLCLYLWVSISVSNVYICEFPFVMRRTDFTASSNNCI
jgi:hypothetical protein